MTPPAWLLVVLDRELPDMHGAERDRIATAIVDAMPAELADHLDPKPTARPTPRAQGASR